ncbi:uncharacterized protein [Drosophila kikkawai]|uniref:Uncharacterized protein n=1 Tax=Drosophila kikkawai TaxID=30033 RepID=A0ABM4GQF1_DROKI
MPPAAAPRRSQLPSPGEYTDAAARRKVEELCDKLCSSSTEPPQSAGPEQHWARNRPPTPALARRSRHDARRPLVHTAASLASGTGVGSSPLRPAADGNHTATLRPSQTAQAPADEEKQLPTDQGPPPLVPLRVATTLPRPLPYQAPQAPANGEKQPPSDQEPPPLAPLRAAVEGFGDLPPNLFEQMANETAEIPPAAAPRRSPLPTPGEYTAAAARRTAEELCSSSTEPPQSAGPEQHSARNRPPTPAPARRSRHDARRPLVHAAASLASGPGVGSSPLRPAADDRFISEWPRSMDDLFGDSSDLDGAELPRRSSGWPPDTLRCSRGVTASST